MIFNRMEIADVLGVHKTTIDNYVREGMPYKARPDKSRPGENQWKFDSGECVKWLVQRAKDDGVGVDEAGESDKRIEQAAKARERMALAGMRELEYAEKLKVMVHVEDIIEQVEEEYAVIKSRIQAIPGRMAHKLSTIEDPAEVERTLKAEIIECLAALSDDVVAKV